MGRKRQGKQQPRDRISELPADIVDMILGFLPIHQAARMAVLSTFWRDMWFSLTKLYFDSRFFFHIMRKYSHACSDIIRTPITQEENKNNDIWMSAGLYVINKILNQHNGPILKFVIDLQYPNRSMLWSRFFDLDQWFLFVTRKGVQEIFLSLMAGDEYRLPNCIFSCPTLRILCLDRVSVESINAQCTLPSLTSLWFDTVDFVGVDLPVPVDFPMLKNLSFMCCDNLSNLNITAQKLYSLTIKGCHSYQLPINSDLRSVRSLDLDSYALEDFVKQCTRRGLQPLPLALNVEYLEVSDYITSGFIHLLQICPKVCQLDLNLLEFHIVAQGLQMLRYLTMIEFVACESDVVFIKRLLACFPALEEVVITRSKECDLHEDFEIYKEELLHFPCASTKAKIVIIH